MSPTPLVSLRRAARTATALALLVLAAPLAGAQPTFPPPVVPPLMERLSASLVGEWQASVRFFGRDGSEADGTLESRTVVRPVLGGMVLEQEGRLLDTTMTTLSHYSVDRETGELRWTALDSLGGYHVFRGGFEEDVLMLTSEPVRVRGEEVVFRRTDRMLEDGGWEFLLERSLDGGATWTPANRQVNRRRAAGDSTAGEGAAALETLAAYSGHWVAEERRETGDGRPFRYEYLLEPFDEGGTILRMRIVRSFEDGNTRLMWEGYKGLDPATGGVYYYGFSPSGRLGRGEVVVEDGGLLVTCYDGWGADGSRVEIRDVFTRLGDDRFRSVTYLRRDGDWQEVNRDHWRRK